MNRPSWTSVAIVRLDGVETTVGAELADARRAVKAGRTIEAFDDMVELATALDRMGRPHDALALLDELRQLLSEDAVPNERWPWLHNAEGISASHIGDVQRAEEAYEQMQSLAEALPKGNERDDLISTALQNRGILYSDRDPERARELLQRALRMKVELGDYVSAADILMSLGLNAQERGDLAKAEEILDDVVSIGNKARDPRLLSAAYANRGGIYVSRREFAAAESDFKLGLKHARRYGEPLRIVLALLNMGSVRADQGRQGQAMRWYRRAIRVAEELGAIAEESRLRRALALALHRRGRRAEAAQELETAIALAKGVGSRSLEAEARADLGAMQLQDGKLEDGIRELETTLQGEPPFGDSHRVMQAMGNLAEGYRLAGRRDEADALLRAALDVSQEPAHEDRLAIAEAGVRLWTSPPVHGRRAAGYLQRQLDELSAGSEDPTSFAWEAAVGAAAISHAGAPADALPFFDVALSSTDPDADEQLVARIRNERAIAAVDVGRFDDAIAELRWCLALGERLDDRALRQQAHANLGEVTRRADDFAAAEAHLTEALSLARALGDREAAASAIGTLALALSNAGDADRARGLYEEQRASARELGDSVLEADAVAGIAGLEFDIGREAKAARLYERAAKLNDEGDPQHYLEYRANALLCWTAAGRAGQIETAAQRLIDASQHFGREDLAAAALADAAAMLLEAGEDDGAVDLFSGAIKLAAARSARLAGDESGTPSSEHEDEDEAFLVELARSLTDVLPTLIRSAETTAAPAALYDRVVGAVEDDIPGSGGLIRELVSRMRDALRDAGALQEGEHD